MESHNHFPKSSNADSFYPQFLEQMKHRYDRMLTYMLLSETIMFVSGRNDSIDDFTKFLLSINERLNNGSIAKQVENKLEQPLFRNWLNSVSEKKLLFLNIRHTASGGMREELTKLPQTLKS
jgi:hypothetical protein